MDLQTVTERLSDTHPDVARTMAQRLHIKKDDIKIVRKFYTASEQSSNDEERAVTARVSTPDIDRDGEVILSEGIDTKEYQKNSILLWAHDYHIPPIGRAMWARADKSGLVCKFQFAKTQFADEIYQLYRDGYMRAFSIGFIPLEFDPATKTHKRISLLEVSAVPVPANQNALVLEAYQKGIIKSASLKRDFEIEEAPAPDAEPEPETKAEETVAPLSESTVMISAKNVQVGVQIETEVDGKDNGKIFIPIDLQDGENAEPDAPVTESFTGPEFKAEVEPEAPILAPVGTAPEAKAEDAEAPAAVPLTVKMSDEWTALAELLRSTIERLAPKDAEKDEAVREASDSVPYMIGDVLVKLGEIADNLGAIRQMMDDDRAAYLAARAEATNAPAAPQAKDDPAPVPEPSPEPPPDVKALAREIIKELDLDKMKQDAVTLALSKMRGRVEVK